MRKIFTILFIVISFYLYSEDKIIKLDNKTIILHDDFTWNYIEVEKNEISTEMILKYDPNETILLRSKNNKYNIHINDENWVQTTGLNDGAQFQFVNKDDTGYGMLIYEGLSFPLKSLKEAIITNANAIDPNARIIDVKECAVNNTVGEIVTYMASYSGLDFIFYTYITTSDKGTIQFTFYTLEEKFEELKPSFINAISGFEFKK